MTKHQPSKPMSFPQSVTCSVMALQSESQKHGNSQSCIFKGREETVVPRNWLAILPGSSAEQIASVTLVRVYLLF